jgi:hypothetical protein
MHVRWGSLGAAFASEKDFQEYMEGIKWWFIMAQAHDGSYVVMPGRDYASTDHVYATRNFPTACAALILSVKEQKLQITGAGRASRVKSASATTTNGERPARQLESEKLELLDQSLIIALGELNQSGKLGTLPMDLSPAPSKVFLKSIDTGGRLAFESTDKSWNESFRLDELDEADRALLSRLVASLMPDNSEAQARAGIYMELSGKTRLADDYYRKAGPEFQAVLEELFK